MKKAERMPIFGIGPILVLVTTFYLGLLSVVHFQSGRAFRLSFIPPLVLNSAGIGLIALGILLWAASLVTLMRDLAGGHLITRGAYGIVRHPLYSSLIVFILPGIALLLHSWLFLSAPIVAFLAFRVLIIKEETDLAERFGREYLEYHERVGSILPKIFRR